MIYATTYFVVSFVTTAKLLLTPEIVNIVYYRKINIILASNILSVILHMYDPYSRRLSTVTLLISRVSN